MDRKIEEDLTPEKISSAILVGTMFLLLAVIMAAAIIPHLPSSVLFGLKVVAWLVVSGATIALIIGLWCAFRGWLIARRD